jgi:hypothetical protein
MMTEMVEDFADSASFNVPSWFAGTCEERCARLETRFSAAAGGA